jgi:hypothetical protein
MDIPALVNQFPLENRVEIKKAIGVLVESGVFDSIIAEALKEIVQAAMVLAHNREYEEIERVSIRAAGINQLLDGLTEASKENYNG